MNDRELLELAAKAAGLPHKWNAFWSGFYVLREDGSWDREVWNPLADDGDALRLAVKLHLRVVFHPVLRQAIVMEYHDTNHEWLENVEDHNHDPYAATRRAIVRAAAEIEKGV